MVTFSILIILKVRDLQNINKDELDTLIKENR